MSAMLQPARPLPAATRPQPASAPRAPLLQPARSGGMPAEPVPPALLRRLQAELGLAGVGVQVDARRFAALPGTAAVTEGRCVWLHPRHFDAGTARGRYLLAHELAHVAQRRGLRLQPGGMAAGRAAAELEAHDVGLAAAALRQLPRPRLLLPDAQAAADTGFDAAVRQRHTREVARIKRLLRGWLGFLWVTDNMVEQVLVILQSLEFVTVRALMGGRPAADDESGAITRADRGTLLAELSDGHRARYRPQVLAFYSVLDADVLARADADIFGGMDFHHLGHDEHFALLRVREQLSPATWAALREDPARREALDRLEALGPARFDEAAARSRANERLQRDAAEAEAATRAFDGDETLREAYVEVRDSLRRGPSDTERLLLLDRLAPWMREPEKLRAVAQRLQNDGERAQDLFEPWLQGFPVARLYSGGGAQRVAGEHRLAVLLRLLGHRDPWRNASFARELATQSWFLDIVGDEEAWLAMQLIGVLPGAMRERLLADLGAAINDNLSVSQRESSRANFYGGGAGGSDLASIQRQLLDSTLWQPAQMSRLAGLVRMAIAARQHEFVFQQSALQHAARPADYLAPDFVQRIVEPFRLYHPEHRTQYDPELLQGVPWTDEGPFYYLNRYAVQAAGFMASSRDMAVLSRAIGGEGLDAVAFQQIFGGSFMGIRFADFESLGEAGRTAQAEQRGVNFIDHVAWDTALGVLEMNATDLAIAAIRYPVGSLLFQAGAGRVGGLRLHMAYPTEAGRPPASLALHMDSLVLQDVMLVFEDSMAAVNTATVGTLDARLGEDAIGQRQEPPREGHDFWSVILLPNLLRLVGPASTDMSSGLLAPAAATALQVTIGSFSIEGLSTSGGVHAQRLSLDNLSLDIAGNRAGYVAALRRSATVIDERLPAAQAELQALPADARDEDRQSLAAQVTRLQHQRAAVQALAEQIEAAEARVAEARRRQAADGRLPAAEQEALQADEALLRRFDHGGTVLDLGRLHLSGLQGAVSLEAIELRNVHGTGSSATALLGALTSSDTLPRLLRGEAYRPPVLQAGDAGNDTGELSLDLGTLDLQGLHMAGSVPTVEEAERAYEDARIRWAARRWDRAARIAFTDSGQRLVDAINYHRLAAIGISYLNESERDQLMALHQALTQHEALAAHHLHAEGATLTLADGGRRIGLAAERLAALRPTDDEGRPIEGGVALRAGTMTVDELHGTGVRAGITLDSGLLAPAAATDPQATPEPLLQRLAGFGLSGATLQASGLRDSASEAAVAGVQLEGFDLAVDPRAGRIDAQAVLARIDGLQVDMTEHTLRAELAGLLEKPEEWRSASERAQIAEVEATLATYRGFVGLIERTEAELAGAAEGRDRERLQAALHDELALFAQWRRSLGARPAAVHDLSVRVAGLGRITDAGFTLDRALEAGITIEGTGRSTLGMPVVDGVPGERTDRLFSSAHVSDTRFGPASAAELHAGEASGRVAWSHRRIALQAVALRSLALTDLFVQAAGHQLWSHGSSVIEGAQVDGSLQFEPVGPGGPAGTEYRLAHVSVDSLSIDAIRGDHLGYWHPGLQAIAEVESGVIGGVWASGIEVDLPADGAMSLHGAAGIGTLTDLAVTGYVEDALRLGRGRLNGHTLDITFLGSAGERIDIASLSLDQGELRTADGHVRIAARELAGHIEHEGSEWRLQGVTLQALTVQRLAWQAGARSFTMEAPGTLHGISVDAVVDTARPGDPQQRIRHLHVDRLEAAHFRYVEPPLTVELRTLAPWPGAHAGAEAFARPPVEAADIDVRDLQWSLHGAGMGGVEAGSISARTVHAALHALQADLDLGALLDAGTLQVGFRRNGVDVSAEAVSAELSGTLAAGVSGHVTVSEAATGPIHIHDDRVELPALNLPWIDVEAFAFDSADYRLALPEAGGQATLMGSTASVTVHRAPAGTTPSVSRVVIHELQVPQLDASGLTFVIKHLDLMGSTRDVTLSIPPTLATQVSGLRVGAREPGGEGFVITPRVKADGETEFLTEGGLGIGGIDAAQLGIEVQDLLTARTDARVESLRLGLLSAGGLALDIEHIDLSQLVLDAAAHHIELTGVPPHLPAGTLPGLSLQGTHYDSTTGSASLRSAAVSGLVYRNSALGLTVELASARLPAGFEMARGQPITLPEVAIDDAWFRLDDLGALLAGSGGAEPVPDQSVEPFDLGFLDALDGTITMAVSIDWWDDLEEVTLHIRRGVVDLVELEDMTGWNDLAVDFDLEDGNLVLNIDWGNLVPGMFLVPQANIQGQRWTDLSEEELRLADDDQARLSTLIGKREAGAEPGTFDPADLVQLQNIHADLQMLPTAVTLPGGGGRLLLGGPGSNAIDGIRVRGSLPSQLTIEVDRIQAATDPAAPLRLAGQCIGVETLVIEQIHDSTLGFSGFTPGALEGRIGAARATGITVEADTP